jgi:Leucine-rich repeat (LRR) protein
VEPDKKLIEEFMQELLPIPTKSARKFNFLLEYKYFYDKMVLIEYLESCEVNPCITYAVYSEGPHNFDRWLELIKLKHPNVSFIYCNDNNLTKLTCHGIKYINCKNNSISELDCPDVELLVCSNNKLVKLNHPILSEIDCDNNLLEELICDNASYISCKNNPLEYVRCSMDTCLTIDYPSNAIIEHRGRLQRHQ